MLATVMLLDMDSTFIDFKRTDENGQFTFNKIDVGDHLIRINFLGHVPVTKDVSFKGEDIDLGQIELREIATELMEVVVKAARASIKLKGDTIEYDARTFKVPEGSSVEDLLKRLPGMRVEQDGSITSDGNAVTKVTVDGKEFFGADPQAATKNLPAEGISKVQVFDEKTEEEEISGIEDNSNQNKTMNLELKEDYKSGAFGKITVGGGNDSRKEIKGNYNRFNDKIQFSLIGVGNNTGRNGLSWDDYRGFMGSQSWSFGDEGVYGFGNGGGMRFISFGGNDDGLESSLQSIFFSGNQPGLPTSANGGINFNYDHNKTKINSYYFVNRKGLLKESISDKETFLNPFNALENSSSISETTALGHRAEVELEQELDSLHTIEIKSQFALVDNEGDFSGSSESKFANENFNTNSNIFSNSNLTNGHLINTRAVFKKKFKSNKRRRLGLNASFKASTLNENQMQNSINSFFNEQGLTARDVLDQNYDNLATKDEFRLNALFVEPISEKISIQAFYNFSNRKENGDREVVDITSENQVVNSFLTRNYENDIGLNRLGAALKYAHEGFNFSLGAGFQRFTLFGTFEGVEGSNISGTTDKIYQNWFPNVSMFFQPFRNSYFNFSYRVNALEPNIRNLQPVIDNSNPLYLREGNPELTPQIDHNFNIYFNFSKPLSGFRMYAGGGHTFYNDQIITEENVAENLVTKVRPVNFDGGSTSRLNFGVRLPLKINKVSIGVNMWSNWRQSNAFVNDELNETSTFSYTPNLRLDITPSDQFTMHLNASFRQEDTEYNINDQLNQNTKNFTYGVELNTNLLFGFKLNSDFNYSLYRNDRLSLDEDIPILNLSVYKQFLKGNKGELRLSIYDLFNQNLAINQFASNYFITRSETITLARYVMFSFTYNLKGMSSKNRGRRRF